MESAQRAVLFVDVADGAKLAALLGESSALALIKAVFAKLQSIVAKSSGETVKVLGDGFICVFEDPENAFRAACDMQAGVQAAAHGMQDRLRVKIGFTYGPVILLKGDVYGDAMNVCTRLVMLANPDQILTSAQTVEALSPGLRERCRALFPTRVKGKAEEVAVCELMWRFDKTVTESNLTRADFAKAVQTSLKLIYRGNIFIVNRTRPTLQMGRDESNDIVIVSLFASRVHARVFSRSGQFVLADLSSNGTFLLLDEQGDTQLPEVHLRREEAVLGARGWIGLGKNASKHGDHSVRFSLLQENL